METAKRIKELRVKSGWTRKELATECDVPYSTLTNYENGTRTPPYSFLLSVAKLFGVTVEYLLGDTPVSSPAPWENGLYGSIPMKDCVSELLCNLGYRIDSFNNSTSRIYLRRYGERSGSARIYDDELNALFNAVENFSKNAADLLFQYALVRENAENAENYNSFADILGQISGKNGAN